MSLIKKKLFSLINNIWNLPFKTLRKILIFFVTRLNINEIPIHQQADLYSSVGLNRHLGKELLDRVLKKEFNTTYDENNGMFSEHLILFGALAKSNFRINAILEIGTFDAKTALILSKLFPKASLTTLDLPEDDKEFSSTYNRKNKIKEFIINRNKILNLSKKIKFKQMNSLGICNWNEKFDLIWIDGAHGYPYIAMDLMNCFRLCNFNGYIIIDDLLEKVILSDQFYKSSGGIESLKAMQSAKLIKDFTLFPKRLGGKYNFYWTKKYVGFLKKN
mgnify:CR=1 FL=1